MNNILEIFINPNAAFLRYALLICIISAFTFGFVGTFVTVKRIGYIAGSISHSILGGIGFAVFFSLNPFFGALIASIVSAIIIGFVSIYAKEREDTAIGSVWALGMALGIIFISKTDGYKVSLTSYLFGNILFVSKEDFYVVLALSCIIVAIFLIFFNKFVAVCFDEEFAKLRGIRTEIYYLLLLCLTAISIVMLIRIVGIIMLIALITIPPAIGGLFAKRVSSMILLSTLFCMISTIGGIFISFSFNLPTGPAIVLLAILIYTIALGKFKKINSIL